jgi:hypothetical protein
VNFYYRLENQFKTLPYVNPHTSYFEKDCSLWVPEFVPQMTGGEIFPGVVTEN